MRHGIHYDIGTARIAGGSTRPSLSADTIEREIADIAHGLHADAVRITGGDMGRMRIAGEAAVGRGLEAWFSPMLPDADASTTMSAIEVAAGIAERLRSSGGTTSLVVGCELSAFMSGILPGESHADRLTLLSDVDRLVAEVTAQGFDPQERFDAFLADAVRAARVRFQGPVTYAAGTWETVDWSGFDLVGVDAYRDAANRAGYVESLRALQTYRMPVAVTEFGCASYRGAADRGSLAWTAVERSGELERLADGIVRDEAGQAAELVGQLEEIEAGGVSAAFLYTYVAPSYPANDDPRRDLDAASYALVRSWPDGRTERKVAYDAVAARYAASERVAVGR